MGNVPCIDEACCVRHEVYDVTTVLSRGVLSDEVAVSIKQDTLSSPSSGVRRLLSTSSQGSSLSTGGVIIMCAQGHVMRANIHRELHMPHVIQGMTCPIIAECTECAKEVDVEDAYYMCQACNEVLCLACSKQQVGTMGMSPMRALNQQNMILNLEPGDIVLVGPTEWGIHHVLLVTSKLTMDPQLLQILKEDPEADQIEFQPQDELWFCHTIECTQGREGDDTWWYPTRTYFKRDPLTGESTIVADWPDGDEGDEVKVGNRALPFKILLHPLRPSFGGSGVNQALFSQAVSFSADVAQRYGRHVAVQAWLQARVARAQKKLGLRNRITLEEYATPEKRERLMQYYEDTWQEPPICASVAIKVWQRYFKALHQDSDDDAMVDIINYMPCWCHRSSPSQMAKDLVDCGWLIVDSLEEQTTDSSRMRAV